MKALRSFTRWLFRLLLLCGLAAGAAYGGRTWYASQPVSSGPAFKTVSVTRGNIVRAVTASGQLNPIIKVDVGSQISGNIQKLFVDYNSIVKVGQLLAQLDPGTYEANVLQAQGNLARAQAALKLATINAERARKLRADSLNPQAEYDTALGELEQAEADVKINEGALGKAQVDLARCKIYTPIDGMVISRNVNVGQTVAASLSAPILFTIADDLSRMQIEADVAEADIGSVEEGQEVDCTVDAFPGQVFQGKVTQIRNAPKADQNVVMYVTVIDVSNPTLKLKPGMTANVSIVVTRRDKVLKLANAALRFRPPKTPETRKGEGAALPDEGAKKTRTAKPKKDRHPNERTVYVLKETGLQPVTLKVGITDGRETEVIEGLQEGETIVSDIIEPKENKSLIARLLTGLKL
jgi:HlyD family secretion protein